MINREKRLEQTLKLALDVLKDQRERMERNNMPHAVLDEMIRQIVAVLHEED